MSQPSARARRLRHAPPTPDLEVRLAELRRRQQAQVESDLRLLRR